MEPPKNRKNAMKHPSRHILPNGLAVVLHPAAHFYSTELALYVKAGSMWENARTTGISHLVEHLVLKGPNRFSTSMQFHQDLEQHGLVADGLTKEEYVFLSLECHPADVRHAIERLFETVARPRLEKNDLPREKCIIEEEYYTFLDENRISNEILGLVFPSHKELFNLIGKMPVLRRITHDQVRSFHREHFCGRNMVLCVTGRFGREVLPLISKLWSQIPPGRQRRLFPLKSERRRKFLFIRKADSPQIEFDLSFPAFPWISPKYPVLRHLSRIVGESACSRLFTKVREEEGLAYDISSSVYGLSNCGIFDIRGVCSPNNLVPILDIVERELKLLGQHGVTEQEFAGARKAMVNGVLFAQGSSAAINDFYGLWQLLGNRRTLPHFDDVIREIEAVKPGSITVLARELFVANNVRFAAMGPINKRAEARLKARLRNYLR